MRGSFLLRAALLGATLAIAGPSPALAWVDALRAQVERIDRETPGSLGLYVKALSDGARVEHGGDRRWYLGSSVKVVIAIAVLKEVEAGRRTLEESLELRATDKVDGSGQLVWRDDGSAHRIDDLLERMLMQSDNTAANMLVRSIGVERLNAYAKQLLGAGAVGPLTDFTEVRYAVYSELHPRARELSNRQLVEIAAAPLGPGRVAALRRVLSLAPGELRAKTIEAAYANYYARGANAATLAAYGAMLEQLVRGRLLTPAHTERLYRAMKFETYDAYRLEAGLPKERRFIHKTGTQLGRACHMGVIDPQAQGRAAVVVAACAQDLDEDKEAGRAFERLGRAITQTALREQGAPPR